MSESVYLSGPAADRLGLYYDRPGKPVFEMTKKLDPSGLLEEFGPG